MAVTQEVTLRIARPGDVEPMLRVIHAAFKARLRLDPPAEALGDDVAAVARGLILPGFGVIAESDGRPVGCLLVRRLGTQAGRNTAMLRRVSVIPGYRNLGVAALMVRATARLLADQGVRRLQLIARSELTTTVEWWQSYGFEIAGEVPHGYTMAMPLAAPIVVPSASDMFELGVRLAAELTGGDLVIASGDLGAGKTTLTQGLGAGLQVAGPVISPTFVLARIHPATGPRPGLVHVDAYRLGSAAELADLDIEDTMAENVTLVEWGAGLAEELSDSRLDIAIARSEDPNDQTRRVYLTQIGPRWHGVDLAEVLADDATPLEAAC